MLDFCGYKECYFSYIELGYCLSVMIKIIREKSVFMFIF